MKRIVLSLTVAGALAIMAWPLCAAADDESDDTEIEVTAPLEATDCGATPPTITVLGLTIDVSGATLEAHGSANADAVFGAGADDGGPSGHGNRGGNDPQPNGCYYCPAPVSPPAASACAALIPGQAVEVKLASDSAPLAATEVKQDGSDARIKIQAPIQSLGPSAQITVLSLPIDISSARLDGADDHGTDGNSQPIDPAELMMGQTVEVRLATSAAPLMASELEVKNFSNQIEVEVDDSDGNPVNDVDDHGNPIDDLQIHVVETISVRSAATAAGLTKKVLRFHVRSNGRFVLSGLATARAKILVARIAGGTVSVGRCNVPVKGDTIRAFHVRLRPEAVR